MAYRTLGLDRIMHTVNTSPGTGNVTLGAAEVGFQAFSAIMATNDTCAYYIEGIDANDYPTGPWERGFGTLLSSTSFERTMVLQSSNAGALVNFTGIIRIGSAPMTDTVLSYPTPGCRLSVSSTVPNGESDSANVLYYVPYTHNKVPLFNSAGIQIVEVPFSTPSSISLAGLAAGTAYDVFAYASGGWNASVGLEALAWTNATTRATALANLNGFLCKSTDPTRRYIGSFYMNALSSTSDSPNYGAVQKQGGKRFVWNMYNRIRRLSYMYISDTSWTYAGTALRLVEGLTVPNGCCEYFIGNTDDAIRVRGIIIGGMAASTGLNVGIGINSTTATAGGIALNTFANTMSGGGAMTVGVPSELVVKPTLGYSYVSLLEAAQSGTPTMYGLGGATNLQLVMFS
jgi:hypothetical protein